MIMFFVLQIRQMNGWGISNLQQPDTIVDGQRASVNIRTQSDIDDSAEPLYWIAPSSYHGNMVSSTNLPPHSLKNPKRFALDIHVHVYVFILCAFYQT